VPAVVTLLFFMFLWGFMKLVVTIFMQAFAMYRMRVAGVWILGAVWSLPFQLLITPFKWASGTSAGIADALGLRWSARRTQRTRTLVVI